MESLQNWIGSIKLSRKTDLSHNKEIYIKGQVIKREVKID